MVPVFLYLKDFFNRRYKPYCNLNLSFYGYRAVVVSPLVNEGVLVAQGVVPFVFVALLQLHILELAYVQGCYVSSRYYYFLLLRFLCIGRGYVGNHQHVAGLDVCELLGQYVFVVPFAVLYYHLAFPGYARRGYCLEAHYLAGAVGYNLHVGGLVTADKHSHAAVKTGFALLHVAHHSYHGAPAYMAGIRLEAYHLDVCQFAYHRYAAS